ncbi:efflux RND transporter periplasmic adaptor subunit [Draconibacterium sediminis]|mgnify:CR=1 FL=1|uniref:efflux RND transporter periplasmic adaptor subunit n=1 Tax=Draconibacterium sediminis TaxID=1544798 RepID=UPI0026F36D8B|nr:efflux RND transporter periplasmic adaptor subunit [Draconibacterium sediminis]
MKKSYWIIGLLILIAASFFVWFYIFKPNNKSEQKIQTTEVVRRDIGSTVLATGIIKPQVGAEVKVGSRVSGVVKKLRANIGDYVQAGQVIAELDNAELQAKLNQNIAAMNKAEADYEYAKLNLERQKSLLEQNYISQQQYDIAENTFKISGAQLKQAEANVEVAKVQLSYTTIYALTSGIISSVSTQEGETVLAGLSAPTFVNIIDLNRLEVQVYVDETDIGKIFTDQEVSFTVDTYTDTDFQGKVTAIYPKAVIQDNVVNYIVVVEIEDFQDKILRPEMTTTVTIYLESRKDVLTVPSRAITREKGERFVTVVDGDARINKKIKTGWYDINYTEVTEGLKEGETILLPE